MRHAVWFGAIILSLFITSASAQEVLKNPDSATIFLLQRKFSHSIPDFSVLAQSDPAVHSADEFHKQAIIDQDVTQLKAKNATLAGISTIVVNLDNSFLPYDPDYHEYDFDISDGSYISYNFFGQQFQIDLTNGTDAQSWALKPDEAEKVLDRNNGGRNVILVMTLKLLDSPPPVDGQPAVLNTQVISYDILADNSNIKLGHVIVGKSQ